MWANNVPGGEPNSLNYDKYADDAREAALEATALNTASRPYEAMWLHAASIPFVVEGGDIDNRAGGGPIVGEPVTVKVPPGHTSGGVGLSIISLGPTNFSTLERERSGSWGAITKHGVTLTPMIKPGGYWLESIGDDYLRDWINFVGVSLLSSEKGQSYDDWETESTVVVPEGGRGAFEWIYPDGRHVDRSLSPGIWRISVTPEGLTAELMSSDGNLPT
jgi:hypothetical protein